MPINEKDLTAEQLRANDRRVFVAGLASRLGAVGVSPQVIEAVLDATDFEERCPKCCGEGVLEQDELLSDPPPSGVIDHPVPICDECNGCGGVSALAILAIRIEELYAERDTLLVRLADAELLAADKTICPDDAASRAARVKAQLRRRREERAAPGDSVEGVLAELKLRGRRYPLRDREQFARAAAYREAARLVERLPRAVELTPEEIQRLPMIADEMAGHADRAITPEIGRAYHRDAELIRRIWRGTPAGGVCPTCGATHPDSYSGCTTPPDPFHAAAVD